MVCRRHLKFGVDNCFLGALIIFISWCTCLSRKILGWYGSLMHHELPVQLFKYSIMPSARIYFLLCLNIWASVSIALGQVALPDYRPIGNKLHPLTLPPRLIVSNFTKPGKKNISIFAIHNYGGLFYPAGAMAFVGMRVGLDRLTTELPHLLPDYNLQIETIDDEVCLKIIWVHIFTCQTKCTVKCSCSAWTNNEKN